MRLQLARAHALRPAAFAHLSVYLSPQISRIAITPPMPSYGIYHRPRILLLLPQCLTRKQLLSFFVYAQLPSKCTELTCPAHPRKSGISEPDHILNHPAPGSGIMHWWRRNVFPQDEWIRYGAVSNVHTCLMWRRQREEAMACRARA